LREPDLKEWENVVSKVKAKKTKEVTIAIVGKYFSTGNYHLRDSYAALLDAIDHASWDTKAKVKTLWIDAEDVEKKGEGIIGNPDGIIVPIGWGHRGSEGMITAASYARRKKIPYLGL